MALGAFLAGLLLAETEFSLQVESDIAPYRGLLLGLFFMTVGYYIIILYSAISSNCHKLNTFEILYIYLFILYSVGGSDSPFIRLLSSLGPCIFKLLECSFK